MEETSLPEIVERESWSSLAYMLSKFEMEFDGTNPKSKKVKKELDMVRNILADELRRMDEYGMQPPASLYVRISKTIDRTDKALENNGVKRMDLLLLLKLILHKLKKQRLTIYKTEIKANEFGKMKEIIEAGYDIVR